MTEVPADIAFLIKEYVHARAKAKEWELTAGGYSLALMKRMDEAGLTNLEHEGTTVARVADGLSSRLDKQRLMKLGVSGDIIAAATVESKRKGYVRVETAEERAKREAVRGGMRSDD